MDLSPIVLAKILLPKLPLLLKTAVLNPLSLSANASKQDLQTELTVSILRELLKHPKPIGVTQRRSLKDPGIKGKTWVAKVAIPVSEESGGLSPRAAVDLAIQELGDGLETYFLPHMATVEAEWTGFRSGVEANAPRPEISEAEHYKRMMAEVSSDVTVLYFHGGAHFLMDPCTHRIPVSRLANLTSGRCLSVRYRLAPQSPFPAALIDALTAYLYLLCPPASSLHSPVPASKIIFAGDSAGGNLCLSLILTLLSLRRKGIQSLRFHGVDVPLSLPCGVASNSPWCDVSHSLRSSHANAGFDYLPPPVEFGIANRMPPDDVWPTTPRRIDMFVNASALIHPLVTPLAARTECWRGAPPTYMCAGSELLENEISIVARRMHNAGVHIRFDGYEGMPHCFAILFMGHPTGKECMRSWAGFMQDAVEGNLGAKEHSGKATWAEPLSNPVAKVEVGWDDFHKELADDEVDRLLKAKRDCYAKKEEEMVREWEEKEEQESRPKL